MATTYLVEGVKQRALPVKCRSTAVKERPERTAQGYRRFRCLDCTKQFNERSGGLLNRRQYPTERPHRETCDRCIATGGGARR
jgi:transposase-like protein